MEKRTIKSASLKDFKVDERGSLGLLAIGYKGLMLWRNKQLNKNSENSIEIIGPVIEGHLIGTKSIKKK